MEVISSCGINVVVHRKKTALNDKCLKGLEKFHKWKTLINALCQKNVDENELQKKVLYHTGQDGIPW